jgi:BirA family transcriptional regulator, biotin operon repressor / biotin---[acetyl-CoA-carboxylase] ligase
MTPAPRQTWQPDVRHIGRPVYLFDELESTQSVAQTLPPGSAVISDHQTLGRGQYGRSWASRPGSSLLVSVVLDPPVEFRRAVVLTAWAAVAVGEAVRQLTGISPRIKWPNDLLVAGKKVCGILTEQGRTVVCGIGLNVNQTAEEFAAAGLPEATSLSAISPSSLVVRDVAGVVIHALDEKYDRLLRGEVAELEAEWVARSGLFGRNASAELADGSVVTGRVRAMGFDGVELDTGNGSFRTLVPEHIRQLRPV